MDIAFATLKPLIGALETAGLPILSSVLAAACGPAGFVIGPALDILVPMINRSLGLEVDATPQQAADAITTDPDAAKSRLDGVQEQHAFLLGAAKQVGEFTLAAQAQQIALNQAEAANPAWWAAGWRPAAAWICVIALGIDAVILPLVQWVAMLFGRSTPPPPDITLLIGLLTGLLGLGVMRSYDKAKGTAPVHAPGPTVVRRQTR